MEKKCLAQEQKILDLQEESIQRTSVYESELIEAKQEHEHSKEEFRKHIADLETQNKALKADKVDLQQEIQLIPQLREELQKVKTQCSEEVAMLRDENSELNSQLSGLQNCFNQEERQKEEANILSQN